jgi:hypothetical protein
LPARKQKYLLIRADPSTLNFERYHLAHFAQQEGNQLHGHELKIRQNKRSRRRFASVVVNGVCVFLRSATNTLLM